MTLQLLLDQKNITKYHLSKISGVPKLRMLMEQKQLYLLIIWVMVL